MTKFRLKMFPSLGAFCARIAFLGLFVVLAPFLGHLYWLFDLFAHLQIQAALCLTALLTLTLGLKHWKASSIIAFILLAALIRLLPLVHSSKLQESAPNAPTLSITTLNVLTSNTEMDKTANFLRTTGSDLLILCETNASWTAHLLASLPQYPYHYGLPTEDNFGQLLLSKWPLSSKTTHQPSPYGAPLTDLIAETPLGKIRIFSAHPLPPMGAQHYRDRNIYLAELGKLAHESALPVIIAGDLNATRWSVAYKDLLQAAPLHDLADGQGIHPTWKPFGTALLGIPIDHLLSSPEIGIVKYSVGPDVGSDHFPVTAVITVAKQ
jgi:endonuclease/exonuclease/phosphatase (EEP) superfamily protein YafD